MTTIPWEAVAWSGFVATALATSLLALLRVWRLTPFSPTQQLGCLFLRDPRTPLTEALGFILLFLLGSTLIPALYYHLLVAWGDLSWTRGALLGVAHGTVSLLLLSMAGTISACVRGGHLSAPGWLGLRWGWATPVGLMAAHLVYGALVSAILAAF